MSFKIGEEVVCINADIITDYNLRVRYNAVGLIKNEIYTCGSDVFIDSDSDSVVFIRELNFSFLANRFRKLDYEFVEEICEMIIEEPLVNKY